ncbi:hypothetical protein V8F33_013344 [Rhypophila sp. PSN 637]
MASPMSLCFTQASQKFKDKEISEEEYYHNVLAHCSGYLHDEDDDGDPSLSHMSSLQSDDVFAYSVQCFMKRKDFIQDITPLENAFKALDNQDLPTIQRAVALLEDNQQQHAKKFLLKLLALRALQLRKAEVLKYCFDIGGFPYEAYFEDEADKVHGDEDPETFKVLEESHFRKIYPRKVKVGNEDDDYDMDESDLTAEERDFKERLRAAMTFDKGGEFPVDW